MIKEINKVEVYLYKDRIGTLALTPDNFAAFEYTADYIKSGVSISPFYLPLQAGVFIAKQDPFNGMFGVFEDSLPDGWGRLLTDRLLRKKQISLNEVSVLHRLCFLDKYNVGALNYKPCIKLDDDGFIEDLNLIAKEVRAILDHNSDESLEKLYKQGGSSGGARPKVYYKNNDIDWIVKFRSSLDPAFIGELEYKYSIMARKCGIDMPKTKLFEDKYFGVQRFDIEENEKYHVHSASGLLYASYRYPSLDYIDLIKATLALTKDFQEAFKIYRQMVFNVITHNRDDHAKNFSFMLINKEWKVSPAYDLVYSEGFNGQHTTTINGSGIPDKQDILQVADETGLPIKRATQIYNEVYENSKELVKDLSNYNLI